MAPSSNWRQYQSSNSTTSGRSERSCDTAPTEYSDRRPSLAQSETCHARMQMRNRERDYFAPHDDSDRYRQLPPRISVDTYASTSEEDVADDVDDVPDYHVPIYHHEPLPCDAIPTTPRDFAELFPTSKRISIRHDDSTIDGNMNLRVDTQVEERGHRKQSYTLFHLRMQDLRTRQFSLRRYCRESGREVCHSMRKYQKPATEMRPVLQRASTALASLVKPDSRPSTSAGLKRADSGYDSFHGSAIDDSEEPLEARPKAVGYSKGRALIPTNTIKLEFSNYAHLDVKRRGAKSYKKYAFEYWGNDYSWKRIIKKEGRDQQESVSYYLVRDDDDKEPLAHICPVKLTPNEAREEAARGGWVPPCYMRITDEKILTSDSDISDVVVATGLIALADDCIKRHFHSKQSTQIHIPLLRNSSFKMANLEYIGPRRLIDEMFNRKHQDGLVSKRRPSPAVRRVSTSV
ncbi:hypothetical protein PtrSN002B_001039 [Pyrenophora tritici-repentis]|uniref:Uncharacterized protein n=2 Tax=Pyrenophora tritici-repentis TaxID=45151 RepID=A0A2W1HUG1_9PLEO|nr:uncharacterized protein PTRG_11144 [Pyrenophora tritici-repentis Pt-1C-BFP]KAA8622273.1 hypothetical protein PtrV1_03579 [Pyrenophora tritici-repentis]EDU44194.1 conserved hypothetical protein [Pyrenophora tritici-repentis Pt-1C-BFP]KAF7451250.1 hypothetical protein A1F99_030270 [Pyrenophora tritici-repentis]KAF7575639.1 hypothetical protein PtrM4_072630 [Pyrenophora tritici-repentis]KAG9385617.1 hypothetical protein A1F94_002367 [Pyrenophora tritici-repentis]